MDKDRKMFIGIILLLFVFMILIGIIAFQDKKEEKVEPQKKADDILLLEEIRDLLKENKNLNENNNIIINNE